MASLGSRRSSDFRELWINSEEDITGVSFKIGLSALSKIMQRLWLTLLEVCCHLFGTGSEVLFLDEELLHSVVCLGCFGQVYPSLKIVADPSDELGRTFTWFWTGGSKPLAEAISGKLIPLQKCGLQLLVVIDVVLGHHGVDIEGSATQ